jgi:hypothetical protein
MDGLVIIVFIFGLVAFIRIELLIKKLKELKVIENNYVE